MTHVCCLLLSVALFSSWGRTIPVDVADPHTWFADPQTSITPINKTGAESPTAVEALPTSAPNTSSQASLLAVIPSSPTKLMPSTESTTSSTTSAIPASSDNPSMSNIPASSNVLLQSNNPTNASHMEEMSSSLSSSTTMTAITRAASDVPSTTSSPSVSTESSTTPYKTRTPTKKSSSTKPPSEETIVITNRVRPNRKRPTNKPFRGQSPSNREQNVPKDSCDTCTDSCKKNKPICSKPVGVEVLDTEKLRGFPSLCHMDCFNSCRKIQYEKLMDGRCGRLKNRVRPVGSKSKLNRVELRKTQYQVDIDEEPFYVFTPLD